MERLSQMKNIGPEVERQLLEAGIKTPEALVEVGSRAAWLRIQARDPSACIHRLMALEGAIRDVKKAELPEEEKAALKAFYLAHRA